MLFSLVVPTYNERSNILPLVRRVHAALQEITQDYEVIIVDDDSPDGTWQAADELSRDDSRLRVIRRTAEKGLATAVIAGWNVARGDFLGVMDADLQHPPEILSGLLRATLEAHADIAIASRRIEGGATGKWSVFRKIVSWGATLFTALVLPGVLKGVKDPMSGCFLIRRRVLEHTDLNPRGFKILLEVLAKGSYEKVIEVPYVFEKRKEGKSKLGPRQYLDFLFHVYRLGMETGQTAQFVRFCTVGFTGVFVNEGALWFFTDIVGLYYLYSSVLAVEMAIVSNFLFNDFWTFRDRSLKKAGFAQALRRFLQFNTICGMGALLNVAVLWLLTEQMGLHYLVSNLAGIGVATLWNYGLNSNITYRRHARH
jgi:dolichol-phosphate mannosyltransferase